MKSRANTELTPEEVSFLSHVLKASANTVYGADYQSIVIGQQNGYTHAENLAPYLSHDKDTDTLDLNFRGLLQLDSRLAREQLQLFDDIYEVLLNSIHKRRTALHASAIAHFLNKEPSDIRRALWLMRVGPGIGLSVEEDGDFSITLSAGLLAYESFTDYAKDCVQGLDNNSQLSKVKRNTAIQEAPQPKRRYTRADDHKKIILAAALHLLHSQPQQFRDRQGKFVASKLGEVIHEEFKTYWPDAGSCPLEADTIRRYISNALNGEYFKSSS